MSYKKSSKAHQAARSRALLDGTLRVQRGKIADILNATVGRGLTSSPRDSIVELTLTEAQLACLKAAVTIGSEESAALGRSVRSGSQLFSPEPFAVNCTRVIAMRLLAVAERSCADVVPAIRTAIE